MAGDFSGIRLRDGVEIRLKRDQDSELFLSLKDLFGDKEINDELELRHKFVEAQRLVSSVEYHPKQKEIFEIVPKVDHDKEVVVDYVPVNYTPIPFSLELVRVGHTYSLRPYHKHKRLEELVDILYVTDFDDSVDTGVWEKV